jgi:hypothetical protein
LSDEQQAGQGVETIEAELGRFPAPVTEGYREAKALLQGRLRDQDLSAWAAQGLAIAGKTVRSWEASAEFFKASPAVQRQLSAAQFSRWGAAGTDLCAESPSLAVAYFKASPGSLLRLRPRQIDEWAALGRSLYRGTWKSSTLACRFYELTPNLLETLSFNELTRFGQFLEVLSLRSYDLASQCLVEGCGLFPRLGTERDAFIAVGHAIAERSWRDVRSYYDGAVSLGPLESDQRARLLLLARRLVAAGDVAAGDFLKHGSAAVRAVPAQQSGRLLEMAEAIHAVAPAAVTDFLRHSPAVLGRISFTQFESWHGEGLTVLKESPDAGAAYFRGVSGRAQEMLDTLASGVELARIKDVVRVYCRALSGEDIELTSTQQLVEKKIGWTDSDIATTEGTTIYLPPVVDRFPSKDDNFAWYKVVSTHQVGHIEFGSFRFRYERPSTLFEDLRPHLLKSREANGAAAATDAAGAVGGVPTEAVEKAGPAPRKKQDQARKRTGVQGAPAVPDAGLPAIPPEAAAPGSPATDQKPDAVASESAAAEARPVTDMTRFFDLFDDRTLAHDVFTVVEACRLDATVMSEYRGIVRSYRKVQGRALEERPRIEELPMREAMVEFIIRLSLQQPGDIKVPKDYVATARKITRIIRQVADPAVTVEDVAEATIRIYTLLTEVPNQKVPEDEFEDFDPEEESEQETPEDQQFYLESMSGEGQGDESQESEGQEEGEEEEEYDSPKDVSYRGDFKPELAQLLSQLRLDQDMLDGAEPADITEEQLQELLEKSSEIEQQEGEGEQQQATEEMLKNLLKEMAKRDPKDQDSGQGQFIHVDEEGGPLDATEENSYVYDEWDFRANEYKPRWCLVREKEMAEGDATFYQETLSSYSSLVRDIHRQFELVVPEVYRKIKRLEDGEDHDLDLVIEAVVDRRTGNTPSEKLFWKRNKVERDVAVAFLLDMSASTAEAIDESGREGDDWGAPDDPVEYMVWLRSRRAEGLRRSYKRIVDIEKESIVLLVNALEMLGDTYGIYGFSGYGRENVEFYVIKDLQERFSGAIPRRIDRIAPLHATRMGPAIRHAALRLTQSEARSKILFMISDGRPQDRGYSREGVEKEYAVHDTKVALSEAKRNGITPFCLTVDKAGHDYLKTMMQDMSYEVLSDIRLLPKRLPHLYKRLTT